MSIKAALDTSSATAGFMVVGNDDTVLLELLGIPMGRETSGLTGAMTEGLQKVNVSLSDVGQWTIGMGPGSFSGIRIGAAFVKGICAGTGASYRGVPSSLAMALAAAPGSSRTVAALYDGRRGEVLISPYTYENDVLTLSEEPYAKAIDELRPDGFDHTVIMKTDRALETVASAGLNGLIVLDDFPMLNLIQAPGNFGDTVSQMEASVTPVYVRPAVFTQPVIRK